MKTRIHRHSMAQIIRVLLVAPGLILLTPEISRSQKDVHSSVKAFLVFPGTESPDGRYAIAWGLPKHPDVWSNLYRFQEQHSAAAEATPEDEKQLDEVFKSVTSAAEDVENYVVDARAGTIIRKLECPRLPGWTHGREAEPDYWTVAGQVP